MFALVALGAVVFWGLVLHLALRFVRAAERRGSSRAELEELSARVRRLEEDLATAETEIGRLSAAERFTTQLLAGRSGGTPPPPPPPPLSP
jgi:hypothetical protein